MTKQDKFFEGYKPDFLSAYGDKQVRDWHKDKWYLDQLSDWGIDPDDDDLYKTASYWHEKAAELEFWRNACTAAKVQLIKAEAQEKNQQAAIKEALDIWEAMDPFDDPLDTVEKMINLLRPFYPLEKEGTKE